MAMDSDTVFNLAIIGSCTLIALCLLDFSFKGMFQALVALRPRGRAAKIAKVQQMTRLADEATHARANGQKFTMPANL
jgi:hypothetical protein